MKTDSLIELREVQLWQGAPSLDFLLEGGQAAALMGPADSGVEEFVQAVLGKLKPFSGNVLRPREVVCSGLPEKLGRRVNVLGLAKSFFERGNGLGIGEALMLLGLAEVRKERVFGLSRRHLAACRLLPLLLGNAQLMIIDGHLDSLDPWLLSRVLEVLQSRLSSGRGLLVQTVRPDVAEKLGRLALMQKGTFVFCGSVSEFLKDVGPHELIIETDDSSTVRQMVQPFALAVQSGQGVLRVQAQQGQELAAKLLLSGYGSVKAVVTKQPSLEEVLLGN